MNSRLTVILIIVCVVIAGVWLARRPSASLPAPHRLTTPVEPPLAHVAPPVSLPVVPKPVAPPVTPKKIAAPKKTPLPKPAAVPAAVPVAPIIPVPMIQPRPTVPVTHIVPEPAAPQEWKGNSDTSIQHAGQIVVQTVPQWVHFWSEHHPDEAAPDVDFSRNMVVGVFLGLRPSDGFQVNITNVQTLADKIVVDYLQTDPPVGTFQVGVTAYPYDIKVIPRSKLRVTFHQLTAQYQRPAPSSTTK